MIYDVICENKCHGMRSDVPMQQTDRYKHNVFSIIVLKL